MIKPVAFFAVLVTVASASSLLKLPIIYNGTSGGGRGEVGDDFPVQVKETSDHEIEGEKLKLTEWYLR